MKSVRLFDEKHKHKLKKKVLLSNINIIVSFPLVFHDSKDIMITYTLSCSFVVLVRSMNSITMSLSGLVMGCVLPFLCHELSTTTFI